MVYDEYIVRTPAETSCDIHQKVVRFNGPPQGFASDYGRSNPREDKATIFELWMLRRQLALARIAGTYEAIESLKDGSWNGEYHVQGYMNCPMSKRGPDMVLEAKVSRLKEEVVRFAPEMAAVL